MMKKDRTNGQKTTTQQDKKAYRKPQVKSLGDIRDVTMGGSPGVGDSGNAGAELPF